MYLCWTQFAASVQSLIHNRIKGVRGVETGEELLFRESKLEGNAKSEEKVEEWTRE